MYKGNMIDLIKKLNSYLKMSNHGRIEGPTREYWAPKDCLVVWYWSPYSGRGGIACYVYDTENFEEDVINFIKSEDTRYEKVPCTV